MMARASAVGDHLRSWARRASILRSIPGFRFLLLLAAAAACLFIVHRGSYPGSLRYTRVAEGNISLTVASIWSDGASAYRATLRADANEWGRIRPAHYLYQQIPFAITLLRNGDWRGARSGADLASRLNGDLQTHTIVLLATFALAVACLAYAMLRISGVWWPPVLFILGISVSQTLNQNLLVYFCDSGEIPQLLWITAYGALVVTAWGTPGLRSALLEGLAGLCLVLAYATKETTVVLMPMAVMAALWAWWKGRHLLPARRHLLWRQAALHVGICLAVLAAVYWAKRGAYVSANYRVDTIDLGAALQFGAQAVNRGIHWTRLLWVSLGLLAVVLLTCRVGRGGKWGPGISPADGLAVVLILVGIAFLGINVPWRARLIKYYLPATCFLFGGLVLVQHSIVDRLQRLNARWAAHAWLILVTLFVASRCHAALPGVREYYATEYGYRAAVPVISADLADDGNPGHTTRALIVAGNLFQEGRLPFLRQLNLLHHVNVSAAGQPVPRVRACEPNYFHIRPDAPAVELSLKARLPDPAPGECDIVYLYRQCASSADLERLEHGGFIRQPDVLDIRHAHILKYRRGARGKHTPHER